MERSTLPRVERVKSTMPISQLDAFDLMSRFLAVEKADRSSLDITGHNYFASSTQIWNDIRLAANSLLDEKDNRRDPVAEWKTDLGDLPSSPGNLPTTPKSPASTPDSDKSDKKERKSAKKEKKEAKKAAKKAKKAAKKEAKKAKKESKKRKRDQDV